MSHRLTPFRMPFDPSYAIGEEVLALIHLMGCCCTVDELRDFIRACHIFPTKCFSSRSR